MSVAAQPRVVVVAARAEPQLESLAEARGITLKFLRRMDDVAEGMPPEALTRAMAEKGQMVLNLTRTDRALRQIVVLEQEVMGLREPATPRGAGSGRARREGADGDGEDSPSEQDLNDLNDIQEFDDLYDLDDLDDREEYEDLESLEKYTSFDKYQFHRKRDWDRFAREAGDGEDGWAEDDVAEEDVVWPPPTPPQPEPEGTQEERWEAAQACRAEEEALKQQVYDDLVARWEARREALFRRRAAEKRLKRRGRWPQAG